MSENIERRKEYRSEEGMNWGEVGGWVEGFGKGGHKCKSPNFKALMMIK